MPKLPSVPSERMDCTQGGVEAPFSVFCGRLAKPSVHGHRGESKRGLKGEGGGLVSASCPGQRGGPFLTPLSSLVSQVSAQRGRQSRAQSGCQQLRAQQEGQSRAREPQEQQG